MQEQVTVEIPDQTMFAKAREKVANIDREIGTARRKRDALNRQIRDLKAQRFRVLSTIPKHERKIP